MILELDVFWIFITYLIRFFAFILPTYLFLLLENANHIDEETA